MYWENGVTAQYSFAKFKPDQFFVGLDYVTSRLGTAYQSNAIKQDSYLLSGSWLFNKSKPYHIVTRLNLGCFYSDLEEDMFKEIPNTSFLISPELGFKYTLKKAPITLNLGVGFYIITAKDGYSATTFEWQEFQDWSVNPSYRVSQVLLGGHGRDYDAFKNSTWEDWRSSITSEYEKLIAQGYTKISLVGSSTGGTLLLELVNSGYFYNRLHPKNIFLVDPIVVPSNKLQNNKRHYRSNDCLCRSGSNHCRKQILVSL